MRPYRGSGWLRASPGFLGGIGKILKKAGNAIAKYNPISAATSGVGGILKDVGVVGKDAATLGGLYSDKEAEITKKGTIAVGLVGGGYALGSGALAGKGAGDVAAAQAASASGQGSGLLSSIGGGIKAGGTALVKGAASAGGALWAATKGLGDLVSNVGKGVGDLFDGDDGGQGQQGGDQGVSVTAGGTPDLSGLWGFLKDQAGKGRELVTGTGGAPAANESNAGPPAPSMLAGWGGFLAVGIALGILYWIWKQSRK